MDIPVAAPAVQATARAAGWRLEHTYAGLPPLFYTEVAPTPVRDPHFVIFNTVLAGELGLDIGALDSPDGAAIFAGNALPDGARPLAQAYAGHQFGHFTGLGDGRAILLGEQITPDGRRVDVQLKGSGPTPYSRRGDGRAALGPMLRELVISEAMHALGIPTSRSLAVVATGEPVYREQPLAGAVLTRVAASHLRVGTFEWAAAHRDEAALRALADYTVRRHYPELTADAGPLALFDAVVERQARLIARWQLVGFIHGVMNTDNMALSGETIDYGPCAFMDAYDPATVFSSIDTQGRYAYGNQPAIAQWNLARLAEAMLPLVRRRPGPGHRAGQRVDRPLRGALPPALAGRDAGQARTVRRGGRRRRPDRRAAGVDAVGTGRFHQHVPVAGHAGGRRRPGRKRQRLCRLAHRVAAPPGAAAADARRDRGPDAPSQPGGDSPQPQGRGGAGGGGGRAISVRSSG